MRKEFGIGLMLCGAALTLQRFINMPEILMGGMLATGVWLELYGSLSEETRQEMKRLKRKLLRINQGV